MKIPSTTSIFVLKALVKVLTDSSLLIYSSTSSSVVSYIWLAFFYDVFFCDDNYYYYLTLVNFFKGELYDFSNKVGNNNLNSSVIYNITD